MNEVDNDPASQAVEIVMNYIKKNPALGLSVQLIPIEGNRTDSKKFLENSKYQKKIRIVCEKLYKTNTVPPNTVEYSKLIQLNSNVCMKMFNLAGFSSNFRGFVIKNIGK